MDLEHPMGRSCRQAGVECHLRSTEDLNSQPQLCSSQASTPSTSSDVPETILSTSEMSSVGEELSLDTAGDTEWLPALDLEAVLKFFSTDKPESFYGPHKYEVMGRIAGTGLAPWEIHRPQKFVRDLVMRQAFSGRLLDAGCGIGDNALYIAKACPTVKVVSVDLVQRCLEFCAAKARLRGMLGRVTFLAADMTDYDSLPWEHRQELYDCVLDSSLFHLLSDAERERYSATLGQLVRRGGAVYIHAVSEEEQRPGGPRRVSVADVESVFSLRSGWLLEGYEPSQVETHPSFWGGKGKARLYTVRRLPD